MKPRITQILADSPSLPKKSPQMTQIDTDKQQTRIHGH